MLENLNDEKANITEEVCNAINSDFSAWNADDAVEKNYEKSARK